MHFKNEAFFVNTELGNLKKILIHSPDGGIGKIIPSTFSDNLYDDIVHLKKMQQEYSDYVKLLLYFLDPEKVEQIDSYQTAAPENEKEHCYIPGKAAYFNSDKVIEIQNALTQLLDNAEIKIRLITAICSYEECSFKIQQQLEQIADHSILAKVLISGVVPASLSTTGEDEYIFPPLPNFIFTRDIAIMLGDHVLLSKMAQNARKRESLITKFLMLYYFFKNDTNKVIEINEESDYFLYEEKERKDRIVSIEGGDVMMIAPGHLLIGCSERTSPNAVNEVVHTLFSDQKYQFEKISVVKIPKKRAQMHIDTIFTQVKKNVWVLYGIYSERLIKVEHAKKNSYLTQLMHKPDLMDLEEVEILQYRKPLNEAYDAKRDYSVANAPEGIEALLTQISVQEFGCKKDQVQFIYSGDNVFPHDDREQWTDSCNVVALKEGVVIGYDRNDKTAKAFVNKGFKVLTTAELFLEFEQGRLTPATVKDTLILLPSAELSRARGGSHCMSMPLLRDELN